MFQPIPNFSLIKGQLSVWPFSKTSSRLKLVNIESGIPFFFFLKEGADLLVCIFLFQYQDMGKGLGVISSNPRDCIPIYIFPSVASISDQSVVREIVLAKKHVSKVWGPTLWVLTPFPLQTWLRTHWQLTAWLRERVEALEPVSIGASHSFTLFYCPFLWWGVKTTLCFFWFCEPWKP